MEGLSYAEFLGISFSHHMEILGKTDSLEERVFYIHLTFQNKWDKYTLRDMLKADLFHHQGQIPNNFNLTLSDSAQRLRAIEMFKDEYLLDDTMRKPHENPSIGIILCRDANRSYVEYVIQDYNKPMGVATYKTMADMSEEMRNALPDIEDLKKLL